MKETGNLLREAREAKGITLQEVSIQLKINTKVLKSIEEGDLAQLPARTFLRGFVQSYGTYLRVDSNLLQEIFQREMGIAHPGMIIKPDPVPTPAPPPPEPPKPKPVVKKMSSTPVEPVAPTLSVDPNMWSNYVKVGLVVFIVVIVALIVGVKRTIEKYEREAQVTQTEVPDQIVAPSPITNTEMTPSPVSTDPAGSPLPQTVTPVVTTPPPVQTTTTAVAPSTPPAVVTPPANPTPIPPATVKKVEPVEPPLVAPVVTPPAEKKEEKPAAVVVETPQEVIVEALDKVTVEYVIDDGQKASIVLNAEKVHTFKAKGKISIVVSDGGSVNLIHNGKDKGVPGNLGQPLKINFPQ